jgi:hydroxyquinol 1,2-dioxygenase
MLVSVSTTTGPAGATESPVLAPFFVEGAPEVANGADVAAGAPGAPA